MGYTTDFYGHLDIEPALTKEQSEYINLIGHTRRMKRDIKILWELYHGKHGNPFTVEKTPIGIYGHEGEYFARDDGQCGQVEDDSIIDYNVPPGQMSSQGIANFDKVWNTNKKKKRALTCQPGLWCQWIIDNDGKILIWDGGEKFYDYIPWLKYYINRFFEPWGVKLNGEIEWSGEDTNDRGKIIVKDSVVKIQKAVVTFVDVDE